MKRRHEELVVDREERIVNFLQPYKNAYLIYLEYLVTERYSKVVHDWVQLRYLNGPQKIIFAKLVTS